MRRLALDRSPLLVAAVARRRRWRSGSSRGAGSPYQVRAIFDDAAFAVPGEDVRIAGAHRRQHPVARRCTHLRPAPNKAAVTLAINDSALHAVLRQRALRDPPAVADRREVRRLPARARSSARSSQQDHAAARARGRYYLPVDAHELAGRLRHRPGHLAAADPAALRADPQRARHRPRRARLGSQRGHPSRQSGARLHRQGAPDPGAPEPAAGAAGDRLRRGARAARAGQAPDRRTSSSQANTTSVASAARAADISRSFQLFPSFLRQLRPLDGSTSASSPTRARR